MKCPCCKSAKKTLLGGYPLRGSIATSPNQQKPERTDSQIKTENLFRCSDCDLIFYQPTNFFHLEKLYEDFYYQEPKHEDHIDYLFRLRMKKLRKFVPLQSHILDLGCGVGNWLKILKKLGYKNLLGVEPNKIARDFLTKQLLPTIPSLTECSTKFDVISLFHVLEHIPEPREYLTQCKEKLNRDGVLIVEVPNIESFGFKRLKEKWHYLHVEHLNYFSPSSLSFFLRSLGFEILQTYSFGGSIVTRENKRQNKMLNACPKFAKNFLIYSYFKYCDFLNRHDFIGIIATPSKN